MANARPARTTSPRFRRHLQDQLLQTLVGNPAWAAICSDRQLHPEVRAGRLTVYYMGQALLREVRLDKNGSLVASVHHKFVPLQRSTPDFYLGLRWDDSTGLAFDSGLSPQPPGTLEPDVLKAYKRMMKYEAGPEDILQQHIASDPRNCVLDQQTEFPARTHNKIDLAYFDPSIGKVCFAEIKRFDDARLFAPAGEPEVIRQLRAYGIWLREQSDTISTEYRRVVAAKRALGLGGRIKEAPDGELSVLTKPVLVIGNCTDADVRQIRQARSRPADGDTWSLLWRHLETVAAGLIISGGVGCDLAIRGGGPQKFWFG